MRAAVTSGAAAAGSTVDAEAATLLALALPSTTWAGLVGPAAEEWRALVDPGRLPEVVRLEAEHLREQIQGLCALGVAGACACGSA